MPEPSWTLARIAELEERAAAEGTEVESRFYGPGSETPNSSTSRLFRSRSNSQAGSSSYSLPLSLKGSRPTTPSQFRENDSADSRSSSRLDIHVKQIVEHVVVTSAVSLSLPHNTPNKIFDVYQSTCNCEGFYTVFSAATEFLAFYGTVNVVTADDIRRKQKAAKKAARAAASSKKKGGFLGVGFGSSSRSRNPSPSPGSMSTEEEWSEIDLLMRYPDNSTAANIKLQTGDKFDRMLIDIPGLSPWTLRQNGVVNPTWAVAVNGHDNGFEWKRISSSSSAKNKSKSGRESSATAGGGRSKNGNLKLVHSATEETTAEFVPDKKRQRGMIGKLVVMGEGVDDQGWIASVIASLLGVLEKQRRTRLEFSTKVDPNW